MPMELVTQLPYDHPYRWDGTRFGGPKLWRPTEIATALWLDAEDTSTITLNGSTVSQWADKSGNGRNVSQATAASQPAYSASNLNGKPGLVFDGSNDILGAGSTALLRNVSGCSVFVVFRYTTVPTVARIPFAILSNSGNARLQVASNLTVGKHQILGRRLDADPFQAAATSSQNIVADTAIIQAGVITYSAATAAQWINGVLDGQNAAFQTAGNTQDTNSLGVFVGAGNASITSPANCSFNECLIIHSALSTADRERMEGYLAWKWGLQASLPADHPYKTLPPTV